MKGLRTNTIEVRIVASSWFLVLLGYQIKNNTTNVNPKETSYNRGFPIKDVENPAGKRGYLPKIHIVKPSFQRLTSMQYFFLINLKSNSYAPIFSYRPNDLREQIRCSFFKMNYAFSKLYLRLLFFVSKCSSLVCSGLLYVQIDASKIVGVSFGVNRKIIV
jgi:hypothetical protein